MSLKFEIYRALLVALGATETILNLHYLISKKGVILARNQHKEIPATVTDKQTKVQR